MRLLSLLLLLGVAAICVDAKRVKIRVEGDEYEDSAQLNRRGFDDYEGEVDDHESKIIKEHISKKKEVLLKERRKENSAAKEEEDEKEEKKPEQNDELKPLEICDGSEDEACHCEMDEVNCVNILFDDNTFLDSLDVALSKKNTKLEKFKPITARFTDNVITRLKRNRMPEGMEEDLAALHLERNKIFTIDPKAFDGFKNISKLILEGNRLRTIKSDMFAGDIEETLHFLNLAHNRITETEKKPFRKLNNLKKLVLDENDIVLTEEIFEGLESLETLSLDDCNLTADKMPKGLFKPLKKLKYLSLRGNKFNEVPEILEEIPHLKILDLSETKIAELHRQSFIGEPEMTNILFEYMPYLTSIQECAFCGLKNLKVLTFHNSTRLSSIDENAFGYKEYSDDRTDKLVDINLKNTNISKVPQYMLEYDTLERLELTNAPINCTCDMVHLRNIKFPSGYSTSARCAYPKEMKGKYLDQVTVREICGARYGRGYRFFFALFGVISAAILATVGYILFTKGYRFTNIRNLPMPSIPGLPGANSAYTNLSRQEENELTESPTTSHDNTPDFQPRPQMV